MKSKKTLIIIFIVIGTILIGIGLGYYLVNKDNNNSEIKEEKEELEEIVML